MTISTEHKSKLRVGQKKKTLPNNNKKIHSFPLSRVFGDDRKNDVRATVKGTLTAHYRG